MSPYYPLRIHKTGEKVTCAKCGKVIHILNKNSDPSICISCKQYFCDKCGVWYACYECIDKLPKDERAKIQNFFHRIRILIPVYLLLIFIAASLLIWAAVSISLIEISKSILWIGAGLFFFSFFSLLYLFWKGGSTFGSGALVRKAFKNKDFAGK
ncbi:MAG: hypothetical protein ACFFCS_12815 [Candidatus Hodarchaeota archaeon]